MTVDQYLTDFETNFNDWDGSIATTGKIDRNKEKAICFYNSKREMAYQAYVGGKACKSTNIKPVTILLRYTKNQLRAEEMAQKVFDFYDERSFFIDNKRVFVIMPYNEPIYYGADEFGVFEYSIELDFYEEV
jgi:hypothetical protein